MKFFIPVLSLFAATSAVASNTLNENDINIFRRTSIQISLVNKECSDAMQKIADTFQKDCSFGQEIKIGKKQLTNEQCEKFNSESCQKLADIKYTELPECKGNNEEYLKSLDRIYKIAYSAVKTECLRDENNKYCSFNDPERVKKSKNLKSEEEKSKFFEDMLLDSCKSKKCTDGYLEYANVFETLQKEADKDPNTALLIKQDPIIEKNLNKTYEVLNSSKCTLQHANASSDASTITFSYSLLIALVLLLSTFF